MKTRLFKNIAALVLLLAIMVPVFAIVTQASAVDPWGGTSLRDDIKTATGLGDRDPRQIAADVINVMLGFLGIIAVVIILLGGFKWMTAGGNDDKTVEARKLITAGVIGLIIILAAFGIARFVVDALVKATGNPTT